MSAQPLPSYDPEFAAAQLAGDLGRLEAAWKPFSSPEAIWHACPAHEWERFDYRTTPRISASFEKDKVERITRCKRCGAPRCDSHDPEASEHGWEWLDDHARQYWRCTLERHHREEHDFLSGNRVDVGG